MLLQKPPLTAAEIAGLNKDLKDMLANPDCAKFAKALLNQLGNSDSDNALTLFKKVGVQGGFYAIPTFPPYGEGGSTIGNGDARIGIVLLKNNQGAAIFHHNLAKTVFHELVHVASNTKYDFGHPQMAQAAYSVAMAIAPDRKDLAKPPQPGSKDYDYQSSLYFEGRVSEACTLNDGGKKK